MNVIRLKIMDVIAFRLFFIIEFILALIIVICFLVTRQFLDIPTYIFGGLILICLMFQLIILTGKNYIEFNKEDINVFFNKKKYKYSWEDIIFNFYYTSDDILLFRQILDLTIKDEGCFKRFGLIFDRKQIYCNKKQFKQFNELYVLLKG